jgi:hypothetical protein
MVLQAADLLTPASSRPVLTHITQIRFTQAQHELLAELAARLERPLSALIRDVVTSWAVQHIREQDEYDADHERRLPDAALLAMVEQVQALGVET